MREGAPQAAILPRPSAPQMNIPVPSAFPRDTNCISQTYELLHSTHTVFPKPGRKRTRTQTNKQMQPSFQLMAVDDFAVRTSCVTLFLYFTFLLIYFTLHSLTFPFFHLLSLTATHTHTHDHTRASVTEHKTLTHERDRLMIQ